ncbi:MAG: acetyl-CoA carboxylase biotin carboxylase subunit, partial [Candidatus Eisenbacteria bacterium]|nr:acetyl-CoA carboxylase biotin carboxylase subunit [Candidatus Latescibacterota bacterium]MBD3302709.1 acetyl-CoA carboxylase biotin carboxylase subunit [Candidatus Eisenbacteria bacterium]
MGTSRSEPVAGRRILVANRGEIACRILRAIREEGGIGIAIYSEADRAAPHSALADEAHEVGPAPVGESYLNAERILEIARLSRAEMVHPGYGFFAENAGFARAVGDAGLIWVGPSPEAIEVMGDKIAAREAVGASGVPVVPGTGALPPDRETAVRLAEEIGYPVLLKAAFGGGGKGMRIARDADGLTAAIDLASREAERAFGDATIYIEKWIEKPRHVEIQLLADQHGRIVHLGERECSIQRRHQKLIEESPSPAPFPGLRDRMGEAAVRIAREIGYANAGTVEFLLDAQGSFYFLEMNTRLQVEHPVTEMVTGVDLVRRQLRIALGGPLDLAQEKIDWRGHAIECRINAEDPEHGFVPATGRIRALHLPEGPGVRNDSGIVRGQVVTPHYDPLLGKLIVWDEDRPRAIARMRRALSEHRIAGCRANVPFHLWMMAHPRFLEGTIDTGLVEEELKPAEIAADRTETLAVAAAVAAAYRKCGAGPAPARAEGRDGSPWKWL